MQKMKSFTHQKTFRITEGVAGSVNATNSFQIVNERENLHAIYNKVNTITTLSMSNTDVLHIDVKYTAFIEELEVKVFAVKTNYDRSHRSRLSYSVYLDNARALEQLKAIENELSNLVAEAKSRL